MADKKIDLKVLKEICESDRYYGYSELMREIGLPVKRSGTHSQIAQLKRISLYCKIEKIGRKYWLSNFHEPEKKLINLLEDQSRPNKLMFHGVSREDSKCACVYVVYNEELMVAYVDKAKSLYRRYRGHRDKPDDRLKCVFNEPHSVEIVYKIQPEDTSEFINEKMNEVIEQWQSDGYRVITTRRDDIKNEERMERALEYVDAVEAFCERHNYRESDVFNRLLKMINTDHPIVKEFFTFARRKPKKTTVRQRAEEVALEYELYGEPQDNSWIDSIGETGETDMDMWGE